MYIYISLYHLKSCRDAEYGSKYMFLNQAILGSLKETVIGIQGISCVPSNAELYSAEDSQRLLGRPTRGRLLGDDPRGPCGRFRLRAPKLAASWRSYLDPRSM